MKELSRGRLSPTAAHSGRQTARVLPCCHFWGILRLARYTTAGFCWRRNLCSRACPPCGRSRIRSQTRRTTLCKGRRCRAGLGRRPTSWRGVSGRRTCTGRWRRTRRCNAAPQTRGSSLFRAAQEGSSRTRTWRRGGTTFRRTNSCRATGCRRGSLQQSRRRSTCGSTCSSRSNLCARGSCTRFFSHGL